jgi:hypothetical protein
MRFLRRKPSKKPEPHVYRCPYCQKFFGEYTLLPCAPPKVSQIDTTEREKRVFFVG